MKKPKSDKPKKVRKAKKVSKPIGRPLLKEDDRRDLYRLTLATSKEGKEKLMIKYEIAKNKGWDKSISQTLEAAMHYFLNHFIKGQTLELIKKEVNVCPLCNQKTEKNNPIG